MATIKSFTSLQQSKKLAEVLSNESADNVIVLFGSIDGVKTVVMPSETLNIIRTPFSDIREVTPCWSLSTLLGVLPLIDFTAPQLIGTPKTLYRCIYNDDLKSHAYDNPIDACYEMILKLHELKML